jgi:hypothetical protein
MAGEGRRLAVKASLAVLAAAASMITAVAGVQADGSPLVATVKVGYHNTIKQGQWMPVVIDVTNNGPALDGTLEIESGSAQGGMNGPPTGVAIYHWPLSIGAGATKHIRTYIFQDQFSGTSMITRVVDHGHVILSQSVSGTNTSGVLIGVLSDRPGTLDGISSVHLGTFTPAVTHITADELPDTALMLRAFDVLAIDDFATDTLTASQRTAIGDYVMNGGALVLGTGGTWRKTLTGLPASVVPMQVTGTTTLGPTKTFGGVAGLEVATGTLSGGNVWLSESNQPLLVEKLIGAGDITMATFDWNQDMVAGWSGTPSILRQVFVRSTFGLGSSPSTGFSKMAYVASVSQKGASLMQSLTNAPALDLPAWWVIGALVLIYVLLVGPINYVVLRAINRRALAWMTVPVISIAASGAAYGASVLTKGTSVQATQVAIVHVEQGWDRAYQETFTGILTPTRGDYDIGIAGEHVVISPIPNYSAPGLSQTMIRVDPSANAITMPGMTAFTLRSYASEGIAGAPTLVAQAQLAGGNLIGTLTNQSTIRFTDAVIIAGGAIQKLPALAPGASVKFSLTPEAANLYGGPQPWTQIYSNYMYGGMMGPGPMTDETRENQTKAAIMQTLPFNGMRGYDRASRPTIVAWTKQPLQDITVNGGHPRIYAESAVVLTLPVAQVSTGALPGGVVTARAVDMEGEIQQGGMPGMVMLQKGTVTYAFTPALGPGMHLKGASLLSTGSSGKGVIGPGGTSAPVKGQMWDWSHSAWVDVPYSDSSNTVEVPDFAANASTGEIRLKLSSDGFFNSGLFSLKADVS